MATIKKRDESYQIDSFDSNGKRIRKSFKEKKDEKAELGKCTEKRSISTDFCAFFMIILYFFYHLNERYLNRVFYKNVRIY